MVVKKSDVDLVNKTLGLHEDMNALSVDKINEMAPDSNYIEPQVQMSMKEIAALEGSYYVEPLNKMPAFGTLPEKLRQEHKRDWEYVRGMFENYVVNGEPVKFWYCKYAGDPDCYWEVPCNKPVYVPRMIAKHLEETMKYHKFEYIEKPDPLKRVDAYQEQFKATETIYRGKFRPIGAFA